VLVTDPGVAAAGPSERVRAAIEAAGIESLVSRRAERADARRRRAHRPGAARLRGEQRARAGGGALKQERLLAVAPREPAPHDLAAILRASL
jgi:hypothetical protein